MARAGESLLWGEGTCFLGGRRGEIDRGGDELVLVTTQGCVSRCCGYASFDVAWVNNHDISRGMGETVDWDRVRYATWAHVDETSTGLYHQE